MTIPEGDRHESRDLAQPRIAVDRGSAIADRVRGLTAPMLRIGSSLAGPVDAVQAPLAVDAVVVGLWLVGRLLGMPEAVAIAIVGAALIAMRWPATAVGLATLVLLFPDSGRHVAGGLILVLAGGVGQLVWSRRQGHRLGVDAIVVAASLLMATTGLALFATIGGAVSADAVRATIRWIGLMTGLLVLPIQLFLVSRSAVRPTVILALGVTAALLLALVDHLVPTFVTQTPFAHFLSPALSDRATGPFDSPNRLGSVAAMTLVIALVAAVTRRKRLTRLVSLAIAAIAAVTLLLSFSRGAMLGAAVAIALLVALRSPRFGLTIAAILLAAGAVVGPFYVAARLGFDTGTRSGQLAANDNERVAAWRAGIRMFASAPLTGHGYGSFQWIAADAAGPMTLETAHNEVIGLLAETGLPGAASFVAIFGIVVLRSLRPNPRGRIALGVATTFVVATMFNVQSIYPPVTVVLWTAIAYGLVAGPAPDRAGRARPTASPLPTAR